MTLEDLYNTERARIRKLALRYSRMFRAEPEDLEQTGALAVCETYLRYVDRTTDEDMLMLSHRIINRMMYKYALKELKHKRILQLDKLERRRNGEIN